MRKVFKIKYIYSSIFIVGLLSTMVSCNKEPEFIDFAKDGDIKLTLEHEGHDFFTDGIAEVELYTAIDGDTAHFKMVDDENGELIKSRFYGIDTPESTGKVQEYGKAASNYTKERLTNANENGTIVVSSPFFEYRPPEADSTGSRYLSLIWINEEKEHASIEELELLNLMIVQNGYSWIKNLNEIPEYVETFTLAEQQARDFKLNLFSGEPDPLFNYGDYIDVSLLELKNAVENSLKDPNYVNPYDGENVRIQGTVAGYADNILYLQGYFDEETGSSNPDGEYAGINIFTGMGSIPTRFTTKNSFIQICGVAEDSENFGFQVTGVYSFPRVEINNNENDGKVLFTPDEIDDSLKVHEFNFAPSDLKKEQFECLFSPVNLTEDVIVTGGYNGDDSITLYLSTLDGEGLEYNVYIPFVYRPNPNDPTLAYRSYEDFVGKTFKVSGAIYNFHKERDGDVIYQLIPINSEGFSLTSEVEEANY